MALETIITNGPSNTAARLIAEIRKASSIGRILKAMMMAGEEKASPHSNQNRMSLDVMPLPFGLRRAGLKAWMCVQLAFCSVTPACSMSMVLFRSFTQA